MNHASIREEHGAIYASNLPDGRAIPWCLLSIGDYIYYDKLFKSNQYPPAYIENEIFKKCVKSAYFCNNIDELKAGTVSNVVTAIMSYSGPHTVDELNYTLHFKRHTTTEVLDGIVGIICQAFPAYKPEEVYSMNYDIFMSRLAQSEAKLIRTGLLNEQIVFEGNNEEIKEKPKQENSATSDLLEKFYAQEGIIDPQTRRTAKARSKNISKPKTVSNKSKQTIVSTTDIKEHQMQYSGHEQDDRLILEHNMVNDTAKYYQEYLDQLKKDGKITFKTDEERTEKALGRSKKFEKVINKVNESRSEKDKKLLEMTIEQRKKKTKLKTKGLSVKRR